MGVFVNINFNSVGKDTSIPTILNTLTWWNMGGKCKNDRSGPSLYNRFWTNWKKFVRWRSRKNRLASTMNKDQVRSKSTVYSENLIKWLFSVLKRHFQANFHFLLHKTTNDRTSMKVSQIDRGGELESNTATGLVVKYWHFVKKKTTKTSQFQNFEFYPNADFSFPRALIATRTKITKIYDVPSQRYPGNMPSHDTYIFYRVSSELSSPQINLTRNYCK